MHNDHKTVRNNLAAAYNIIAALDMGDLIYTHISARVAGEKNFYICKFGDHFAEVTPENLMHVDFDGRMVDSREKNINQTGFVIHRAIYVARPDINAIFHLHTEASIAVSIMKCGLLALSQFSYPFFNRLSYYEYDSLALNTGKQGQDLANALGTQNKNMLLRNHGSLTCGANMSEAFYYTRFLENACRVQCKAMSFNQELTVPKPEICEQAAQDMLGFEKPLGKKEWEAAKRIYLQY